MTSPRKRPVRATPPARQPKPAPVETRGPNPRDWEAALHLAGGDHRRLTAQPDGSVIIR